MKPTLDSNSMIDLLGQMVHMESPSHEKEAVDKLGGFLQDKCRAMGGKVILHAQEHVGNHIEARFFHDLSNDSGKNPILLLCHMDTVFQLGTGALNPFRQQGKKFLGPGVADMKGGIAVALGSLSIIIQNGNHANPVTVLFTSDEEIGSTTSRKLIEKLAKESSLVLVLEPGSIDGAVKTWRKGVGDFSISIKGRAAHAGGDHQGGRNAIEEMARQVLAIQAMTDYDKGTTLNVGIIHGGTASNVVPEEARIIVDMRVMQPGEAERITTAIHSLRPTLPDTSIHVSGGLNRPPMAQTSAMQATFERIQEIARKIGIRLTQSGTGGASDGNFVAPLGIPLLDGMGPAGAEFHSEREYILRESLLERTRLLAAILKEWRPG